MIQKIDWTRGFCKAEINCISFCYLLLRTNSHFKLNICHICILYVNFLFFSTMFSMGEMHKTTTLSSTTSIFVCISFPSPSCYLLIKTEKKQQFFNNNNRKVELALVNKTASVRKHRCIGMHAHKKCQAQFLLEFHSSDVKNAMFVSELVVSEK